MLILAYYFIATMRHQEIAGLSQITAAAMQRYFCAEDISSLMITYRFSRLLLPPDDASILARVSPLARPSITLH